MNVSRYELIHMSYVNFSEQYGSNEEELPFLPEYFENSAEDVDGEMSLLLSVNIAKSGKGYLLKTNDFMVWLWKKDNISAPLIELLEKHCTEPTMPLQIVLQIQSRLKSKFQLLVKDNEGQIWRKEPNCYRVTSNEVYSPGERPTPPTNLANPEPRVRASQDPTPTRKRRAPNLGA